MTSEEPEHHSHIVSRLAAYAVPFYLVVGLAFGGWRFPLFLAFLAVICFLVSLATSGPAEEEIEIEVKEPVRSATSSREFVYAGICVSLLIAVFIVGRLLGF